MIKKLLFVLILASTSALADDVYVHGYEKSNGTYVQPYHRTSPDNTVNNNYGTQGNLNPYTNESGTRPRNLSEPQGQYNNGNGQGNKNTYSNFGAQ